MASSSSGARCWRTAFLTLRDETLSSPPLPALRDLILSHSHNALVAAAADLPPHEVASDLVLLAELGAAAVDCPDSADTVFGICHLIHDVGFKIRLKMNSSSWTTTLKFFGKVVQGLLGDTDIKNFHLHSTVRMKVIPEILGILRLFNKAHGRNEPFPESDELMNLLLCLVSCLHTELLSLYHSSDTHWPSAASGIRIPKSKILWEMQTIAISMIEDAFTRIGSSVAENLWLSIVECLRKVTDFLASKNLLIEDNVFSRFSATLLQCLHLLISDPKGSLSGHVSGFVATLQMFLMYGLRSRSILLPATSGSEKRSGSPNLKSDFTESTKSGHRPYRPPHLRRREQITVRSSSGPGTSDSESSAYSVTSSDSDQSDSDGSGKDGDHYGSSKARVAAIICIQDLFHADPKSLSSLWTMLLPTNDVLQPRKYQPNLMTCLLFDPVLKVRLTSASTLASMLSGHSLTFLQVAEFKESTKCGSFTTLSSSLGQVLIQLHRGMLYLIQHEKHSGLLPSLFKVLMLLISATPYARLPGELLPNAIASICTRAREELASNTRDVGLMVSALSCLVAALSKSPPSLHVLKMLKHEAPEGVLHNNRESGVVYILFQFAEHGKHPTIKFEALQALKALAHSYPNIATTFWERISAIAFGMLQSPNPYNSTELIHRLLKEDDLKSMGSVSERCIMAAVKVLDECLRAASGFTGADDLIEPRLQDLQIKSDRTIRARVSSAPSYDLNIAETANISENGCSGCQQWCEVIEKHLPLALSHNSAMVRAASVTCFAGMTSSIFFSLSEEMQEFVISSAFTLALNEEISSVKSAACRAIGVISCFSRIFCRARVLNDFIHAVVMNTHDPLATVRIPASWALANICDSLRHMATNSQVECSTGQTTASESVSLLVETALLLTKDGDKIKANAVRALGNLSRFIIFTQRCISNSDGGHSSGTESTDDTESCASDACKGSGRPKYSHNVLKPNLYGDPIWLERMVRAFVSCVTTGNVKVQWNVCHALGNLFMNKTVMLHVTSWAPTVYSILLLLLRDSTNYKIRIHAAVALAVPESRLYYSTSFSDVIQGLEHVLESLGPDHDTTPLSFKYKDDFEKQLTLTILHVLGFASSEDDQSLNDFLVKKASFLEEWFSRLCLSITQTDNHPSTSMVSPIDNLQDVVPVSYVGKKEILSRAIKTLSGIYERSNHQNIAHRFEKLGSSLT